jgi:hypothetical protein
MENKRSPQAVDEGIKLAELRRLSVGRQLSRFSLAADVVEIGTSPTSHPRTIPRRQFRERVKVAAN